MQTTTDMQPATQTELLIGTDKIVFEGDNVLIHATEAMDWRIREFCKVPIWFRDQKYYLLNKRAGQPPRGMIYELTPWPQDLHGAEAPQSIRYDEDYVTERNRHNGSVRRHDSVYHFLVPLYPFLGLTWSNFKNETLARCGFDPQAITSASVFLVFVCFSVQGTFIGRCGGGLLTQIFGPSCLLYDVALAGLLGLDTVVRYVYLLNGNTERPLGFCQWLFPKRAS